MSITEYDDQKQLYRERGESQPLNTKNQRRVLNFRLIIFAVEKPSDFAIVIHLTSGIEDRREEEKSENESAYQFKGIRQDCGQA